MIVTIPPSEDEPLYSTRGGILIHPALRGNYIYLNV